MPLKTLLIRLDESLIIELFLKNELVYRGKLTEIKESFLDEWVYFLNPSHNSREDFLEIYVGERNDVWKKIKKWNV